jgi:hypothetical protein
MATATLEHRVTTLERELSDLKSHLTPTGRAAPWWDRIAGTFSDDPAFEEAMELGRQYRRQKRLKEKNDNGHSRHRPSHHS